MQHIEPRIDADRVYTPEDVAEIFRVPPATIRRLVRQGSIHGFAVGGMTRIFGADLRAFITGGGARVQYDAGEPDDPADTEPEYPTKIDSDAPALADVAA